MNSFSIYKQQQPPFVDYDKVTDCYKGYAIDLLIELAKRLKFDYSIRLVEDGRFGDISENNTWNGVVRKLIDKEADIGLGSMYIMAERETVIDFTVPYHGLVGSSIMMKAQKVPNSLFKFLTVLELDVWLCVIGTYLVAR